LNSGIACGAEVILIPESKEMHAGLKRFLDKDYKKKKRSGIIIVAEGDEPGGALKIAEHVRNDHPELDVRVSILGQIQRGGSPTANDRIYATKMGVAAIDALLDDQKSIMIGLDNGKIVQELFNKAVKLNHSFDDELLEIQKMLNIQRRGVVDANENIRLRNVDISGLMTQGMENATTSVSGGLL
jgi:6-phosphofructokinase 1